MSDLKKKLPICLLYDFKQGKTAAESHRSISNAFGEDVINERKCQKWFQRFLEGDVSLEDKQRKRAHSDGELKEPSGSNQPKEIQRKRKRSKRTPNNKFEVYKSTVYWDRNNGASFNCKMGDIDWKLIPRFVKNKYGIETLAVDVEFQFGYQKTTLWKLDSEISIYLRDGMIGMGKMDKKSHTFNRSQKTRFLKFNFGDFLTKNNWLKKADDEKKTEKKSFLPSSFSDVHITLKVRVRSSTVGIRTWPTASKFATPLNNDSQVLINVEDRTNLHIDKYVLLSFSSVFREMLSNAAEASNTIKLEPNINNFALPDFFHMLCKHNFTLTERNVTHVLALAIQYDVPFLISDCEDFIISTQILPNNYKLHLAEEYTLPKLQTSILDKLSVDEIKQCSQHIRVLPKNLEALTAKLRSLNQQI